MMACAFCKKEFPCSRHEYDVLLTETVHIRITGQEHYHKPDAKGRADLVRFVNESDYKLCLICADKVTKFIDSLMYGRSEMRADAPIKPTQHLINAHFAFIEAQKKNIDLLEEQLRILSMREDE